MNKTDRDDQSFQVLARAIASAGFRGEVITGLAGRAAMSTDNSVYQVLPDLVIAPRDSDDLAIAMRVLDGPEFTDIPITARGGGTGTNGQALNRGVIVDFRRFMNRVLTLNLEEGWVEVEPGIVLDTLNDYLAQYGAFFAPTTSTASRCTIGGMIGTDAAGKGSSVYGKTADHVISLELMLSGGTLAISDTFEDTLPGIAAEVAAACALAMPEFEARIPTLPRRFSGYDLTGAMPEPNKLIMHRLVVGAESTLGLVTRARLRLTARPAATSLVLVSFSSLDASLRASPAILQYSPIAVEILDEFTQGRAAAAGMLDKLPDRLRQHGTSCTFVEFSAGGESELAERVRHFAQALPSLSGVIAFHTIRRSEDIARLWAVRAAAVGLLAESGEGLQPVSGFEDCAVPPERLADFVSEFRALLSDHSLECGIYGHADVGCVHVRPLIKLETEEERDDYASLSREVYELTRRHGGIFWGEHGKGVRGEFLRDFAGDTVYQAFLRIKRAFDPQYRFNPGKLVDVDKLAMTVRNTPFRVTRHGRSARLSQVFACNGNAACLNQSFHQAMCPSFKVTGDLRHSPKGRAEALKVWQTADPIHKDDIEAELLPILDGCLGCKACASNCPVRIDIPELKSRFLDDYYTRNRRPIRDSAVIALESFAPLLNKLRPIAGLISQSGLLNLGARAMGYIDLPSVDTSTNLTKIAPQATQLSIATLTNPDKAVVIIVDPFCGLFDLKVLTHICRGFRFLGYVPLLSPILTGGKSAHVKGALRSFRDMAQKTQHDLNSLAGLDLPLIGADPSFVLMLRSEYKNAGFDDLPVVQMPDEFLIQRLEAGDEWPRLERRKVTIMRHCTEASVMGPAKDNWQRIFSALGMECEVPDTGCCGMSGLYGHEKRNFENSSALFNMSWRKHVENRMHLAATGFSCRCQIERLTDELIASHPLAFFH